MSLRFDKHDFTAGKVDACNPSARNAYARRAISVLEGASELLPLRPPEPQALQDVGDRAVIRRFSFSGRVRKVTEMLDNSGG